MANYLIEARGDDHNFVTRVGRRSATSRICAPGATLSMRVCTHPDNGDVRVAIEAINNIGRVHEIWYGKLEDLLHDAKHGDVIARNYLRRKLVE